MDMEQRTQRIIEESRIQQEVIKEEQLENTSWFKRFGQALYFGYQIIIPIYTTVLLIVDSSFRQAYDKPSYYLVLIYGYLPIFFIIFTYISSLLRMIIIAIYLNRIGYKILSSVFPIFAIICFLLDRWMVKPTILAFCIFMIVVSIFMISYMIYSCTCGQIQNPAYIFFKNNLNIEEEVIHRHRMEFLQKQLYHSESTSQLIT